MKTLILAVALAITISGSGPNTIEQCPNKSQLKAKIAEARETIQRFQCGHVIVGRVVLDGPGDVRYVNAQMEILPEGYFAGPVKDLDSPVGFRLHQYAPYDLQIKGLKKDKERDLLDVGTIHLKPLNEDELADLKARLVLEQGGDLSQANILLTVSNGPVNTPSNSTEPRRYWPEPIKVPVQQDGNALKTGFSPIKYWCRVEAPGYLEKSFQVEFKKAQTLDLGTVTLEKPKQIKLTYIVSKEPPFDMNDLKTVIIPAETKWKAADDIYGWDLEFKQDKGAIIMDCYEPCYLWDLGEGNIEQYIKTGKITTPPASRGDWPANNKHVYLLHQDHWKRWVLFKIEYTSAGESLEDKLQEAWTFVSFPDFFNFDVPNPWPLWDDAVDFYLEQVKSENPDFVLIAGDLVNGHWWDSPQCIEQMAALYYPAWIRRMQKHDLKYYVAVGDHELGDDPWPKEKLELVPHFERAFAQHLRMPDNGPQNKKGLAYYVLHKNILIVTVETFELQYGKLHTAVLAEQLEWLKDVLAEHKDVKHIIVQGHVPVFGNPQSRSSSELMLEGAKSSQFWQVLKNAGVDLYLCGEFHAVTAEESDGIWQIVHGSSWGREIVNTQDYLVCTVFPDSLHLEMKSLPLHAKGGYMWNLNKDKGPREIVEIPAQARQQGPKITGTLIIHKSGTGKKYLNRTGVFQ